MTSPLLKRATLLNPRLSRKATFEAMPSPPAYGAGVVYLGDSITAGSGGFGATLSQLVNVITNGSFYELANLGLGGNTTQQMVDRFDAEAAPYITTGTIVHILGGTNDAGRDFTPIGVTARNLRRIVNKVKALGGVPIIGTIPPHASGQSAAVMQATDTVNHWVRTFAQSNGIPLVDYYATLVDPTNGNYGTGAGGFSYSYGGDITHPSATAYVAMAQALAAVLSKLPVNAPLLARSNADVFNNIANGLMVTSTAGYPNSYVSPAAPTGSTRSLVTVAGVPGNVFQAAMVTPSGADNIHQTVFATGRFSPGDVLAVSMFVGVISPSTLNTTTDGLFAFVSFAGGVAYQPTLLGLARIAVSGRLYTQVTVPAGATSLTMQATFTCQATGSVTYQAGAFGVYNLTKLGAFS